MYTLSMPPYGTARTRMGNSDVQPILQGHLAAMLALMCSDLRAQTPEGDFRGFAESQEKGYLKIPATLERQDEMASHGGATHVVFHDMYIYFFFEAGQAIGDLGAFSKDEYWPVIEKANSQIL